MRVKYILAAVVSLVLAFGADAAQPGRDKVFRQALNLYQNQLYEGAKNLLETVEPDAVSDGYIVLCALKMRSDNYPELVSAYRKAHPSSGLTNDILFENARLLFDGEKYLEAAAEFEQVNPYDLLDENQSEYWFKRGFSEYSCKRFDEAVSAFERLENRPVCDYTACAYYLHGTILYNRKDFAEAVKRFEVSVNDSRFRDLSRFYLVDCQFNLKNYDYAITEGEALYENAPKERRERLARIISGSYLVQGDSGKAREYYEGSSHTDLNRSDIFYSASVLYAVEDYEGAIGLFNQMPDRTDSLGQIANYQLANSYLRTDSMKSAMKAFKDASEADFDAKITEDALFNYAKLSYDLNKDTAGFSEYIRKYPNNKGEMIYSYMALAKLVDRDYAGAVDAYDNIDELGQDMKSNYTKANFLRADQLMKAGKYAEALPYLRTCSFYLGRNDRFGQLSRYCMADSYYRTENYKEAARTYLELYNADAFYDRPEGRMLPYNIGYSYLKQENYDSAAKWFQTYIDSGDSTWVTDAEFRLATCDRKSQAAKDSLAFVIDKEFIRLPVPDSLTRFDYKFDYSVFESPYKGAYEFSPYYVKTNPSKSSADFRKLYLRAGAGYSLHPELDLYWTPVLTDKSSLSVFNSGRGYAGKFTLAYGDDRGTEYSGYDLSDRLGLQADWINENSFVRLNAGWDGIFTRSPEYTSAYNSAYLDFNVKARNDNPSFLYYDLGVVYRYAKDNFGVDGSLGENYAALRGSIGPVLQKKFRFLIDFNVEYDNIRDAFSGLDNAGYFLLNATPHIHFTLGPVFIDAGARFDFGHGKGNQFSMSPDVTASLAVAKDVFNIYAGFVGGQKLHTYSELKFMNHYNYRNDCSPVISKTQFDAYAGFKGEIGQHFDYDIRGGYKIVEKAPLPFHTFLEGNMTMFYLGLGAGWRSEDLQIDGSVQYTKNTIDENSMGYLEPAFKGDLRAVYNWYRRIYAGLWLDFCSDRKSSWSADEFISWYLSPGLYAEYRLVSGVGFWIQGGNLLGHRVQRTPGYVEKGPYVTVGVTLNL
ncbi:MAG: tetratricopeptide repeat protein [Bacteroidia bacterium]|nr:tetratricopeptide repeat protein [Bacteroidia bacterium]